MPQIEELTLDDLMELASFAFPAREAGVPKVQMDSAHAVSLIALAAKSHRQAALIASQARRIEELEGSLEPFAAIADEYSDSEDDAHQVWKDFDVLGATLPLHHFRRARATLKGETP